MAEQNMTSVRLLGQLAPRHWAGHLTASCIASCHVTAIQNSILVTWQFDEGKLRDKRKMMLTGWEEKGWPRWLSVRRTTKSRGMIIYIKNGHARDFRTGHCQQDKECSRARSGNDGQVRLQDAHCNENHIYVFLFWEFPGLSLNFHIMCLWEIYIFPGSVHVFSFSRIGRPILEKYKSLTDIWV